MNVLIHGPFGLGSLADEAILAGILARYATTKHGVTVLTADPENTKRLHGNVTAILHASPKTLLSNKAVWKAFDASHLFVLCSGGAIGYAGEVPSRYWLGQLELVHKAELKVAVMGVSAEPIKEMRESVRVQRLLHHFADAVSTRDDESKRVLSTYGLNANRVSVSGDLALGIAQVAPSPEKNRVALFISSTLPSRGEFGYAPVAGEAEGSCASAIGSLATALLKDGKKLSVFHNADEASAAFARNTFNGFDPDQLTLIAPDRPFNEILQEVAKCEGAVSFTYHGALLSALCGVPSVSFAAERGMAALAKTLGLEAFVVPTVESSAVLNTLQTLLGAAGLRETLVKRVSDLRKKEAQNLRAMEALVPKRDVYAKEKQQGKYAKEEFEDPIGEGRRKKRTPGKKFLKPRD